MRETPSGVLWTVVVSNEECKYSLEMFYWTKAQNRQAVTRGKESQVMLVSIVE